MLEEWKLKLISKPFELKQNEYDCDSTFIIFLCKAGVDFDRDDFGDLILDYEAWGIIDPPGPVVQEHSYEPHIPQKYCLI